MKHHLTRRDLLRISAATALGGSALGALAACANTGTVLGPGPSPTGSGVSAGQAIAALDAVVLAKLPTANAVSAGAYIDGVQVERNYAFGVPTATYTSQTVYGIGSNTKVFTATLLALQCVGSTPPKSLDDGVAQYLPAGVLQNGHAILDVTLRDLATHTASFPDFVSIETDDTLFVGQPPPADQTQWWTDWDNAHQEPGSTNPCLTHPPGTCWNYSDWGFITLGFAVANDNLTAGATYSDLLASQVTQPLGMPKTGANVPLDVQGHTAGGVVVTVPPPDLKSNVDDLMRFLRATLGALPGVPSHLNDALLFTRALQWNGADHGDAHDDMGLAWQLPPPKQAGDPPLVWKNGEASGFTSFLGMLPSLRTAVAILTNTDAANPTAAGTAFLDQIATIDLPTISPS